MNGDNGKAIDLNALLAEPLTAEQEASIVAYNAETERHAHEDARRRGETADACSKCRGTGHLPHFRHVAGGACFECDGTGIAGMGI